MVIISANKRSRLYSSSHMRYAMVYIAITLVVLIFLNIYSIRSSQELFSESKQTAMIERCQLAALEIINVKVLTPDTAQEAVANMESTKTARLVIANLNGLCYYDSLGTTPVGEPVNLPEVTAALEGNNVFNWRYQDGAMVSHAATPVYSHGIMMGCVYMMDVDSVQGALIHSLQQNTRTVTVILAIVVIAFSILFSRTFSRRVRRIMASMRIIRDGDYSHRLAMGGNDELTFLADEVNDLTERLQLSEDLRRQFVSDASHELKTPLASIKLLSDSILQNDMDMETIREFVGDIGHEADRLNRMSQKLLSLTRIESQQDGDCEIVYMAPTVQRVARMLSGIAMENCITLELQLQQDCPILILEDDLYQITFNLVENGIKYNTPGGDLTVSLHRDGDNAILRVGDTGVGIPEDALEQIFERFYRVDKARSRKSGGSGLGLAIVKSMVERNQGSISVESAVGKGTVFTVIFPIFDTEEESQ